MSGLPDESHRLRPDHLPTPFTAAQIRDASRPGREIRARVARAGEPPVVRAFRFIGGEADFGDRDVWMETPEGQRLTEPERDRSTWRALQEHASMPADRTVISEETFEIPAGRFEGWRYTRTDEGGVSVFWFARSEPGMPLRYEQRVGDEVVFSSTVIEIREPSAAPSELRAGL
jgi:hypothetical protein